MLTKPRKRFSHIVNIKFLHVFVKLNMAANYTTNPGETFVWACGTLRLKASLQGHSYDDLKRRCLLKTREHWVEDQAFSSSYDLASPPTHPLPSVGSTGDTQEDWERETTICCRLGGGGGRAKSWQPESLVRYKSFHTLCSRLWSTTTTMRTRIWTTTTGTSGSSSPRKRVENITDNCYFKSRSDTMQVVKPRRQNIPLF